MNQSIASRLLTSALIAFAATAAPSFAESPSGAIGTGCDANAFVAVKSPRTSNVLYWNNPTFEAGGSGSVLIASTPLSNNSSNNTNCGRCGGHHGRRGAEHSHSTANSGGAHARAHMDG